MTLTVSKSQNLTKDPEQSPNPYLCPLRKKKNKNPKMRNSRATDEAVIVKLSGGTCERDRSLPKFSLNVTL